MSVPSLTALGPPREPPRDPASLHPALRDENILYVLRQLLEEVASPQPGNPMCQSVANFLMSVYGRAAKHGASERAVIAQAAIMLFKATPPHYWRVLDVLQHMDNGLHDDEDEDEFKARQMLRRNPPEMDLRIFGRLCTFYRRNEIRRQDWHRFLIRCAYTTLEVSFVHLALDDGQAPTAGPPWRAEEKLREACAWAAEHFQRAQDLAIELDQELVAWQWAARNGLSSERLKKLWKNSDHGRCAWLVRLEELDVPRASDVKVASTTRGIQLLNRLYALDGEEIDELLGIPLELAELDDTKRGNAIYRWSQMGLDEFRERTSVVNSDLFRARLLRMQQIGKEVVPRGDTLVGRPNPYGEEGGCPFRWLSAHNGLDNPLLLPGWDPFAANPEYPVTDSEGHASSDED